MWSVGNASAAVSTTGLVAAYSFDEGSGTSAADVVHNNTATLSGGTTWVAGKNGSAVSLSASGQKVVALSSPETALSGSLTIEAWVKPTTLTWGVNKPLVIKAAGYPSNYYYAVDSSTPLWKWSGGSAYHYANTSLQIGVWQHMAMSYNADTRQWTQYINGVARGSGTENVAPTSISGPLYIGSSDGTGYFPGAIDDVRIYNRALSASEIQSDMDTAVE